MFQGTGSSVGKSILVTAICRILSDAGYRVAPFKSQNMALNSYITHEGDEMGRAQVAQAEAARILPNVSMNPILLKPTSDIGCQVILNGKVYKNLGASEYFTLKEQLVPEIVKAFKKLEEAYDCIVIEGAGSPAEINLRSRDVVNMGLAELIDTDVVLIGDVDKGGVFASLYGTYALLDEKEQKRVKGFIINKFRGDVSLLLPGVKMIEEKINVPCLGILPYISEINIDDEDSVSEKLTDKVKRAINIGVVKLPHMSNFTDFNCFDIYDDVAVHYISKKNEVESCDLIVIPGSKNTISDMSYIYETKLDEAILNHCELGKPLIGICGGYQILGNSIFDPYAVESSRKEIDGLGLLNMDTLMEIKKETVQSTGRIKTDFWHLGLEELEVNGYEIHMGKSVASEPYNALPFLLKDNQNLDGLVRYDGLVLGTYFHGIFDNDEFRERLVNKLRQVKGLEINKANKTYLNYKEEAYRRLAKIVSEHLDMKGIMQIVDESRPTP